MERSPLQLRTTTNQDNIPKSFQQDPTSLKPQVQRRNTTDEDQEIEYHLQQSSKKRQPTTPLTPSRHTAKTVKKPNNRPSMEALLAPVPIPGETGTIVSGSESKSKTNSYYNDDNSNQVDYTIDENGSPVMNNNRRRSSSIITVKDMTNGIFDTIEFKLKKSLIISAKEMRRMEENLKFASLERKYKLEDIGSD